MPSHDDESLISQLHDLGARTAGSDSTQLTDEQACTEYGVAPAFFREAWPAYFAKVEKGAPRSTVLREVRSSQTNP